MKVCSATCITVSITSIAMQFPHSVKSLFYKAGIFVSRTNHQQQKKLISSRMTSSTAGADDGKVRPKKVKRRQFVGLAKAVDRGQFATVYQPLGKDGTFTALSGLPNTAVPFTVLGIESSCDDTGGIKLDKSCFVYASPYDHLSKYYFHIFSFVHSLCFLKSCCKL